jgi:hypothetical protein
MRQKANLSTYAEREYGVSRDKLTAALERLHRLGESNRQAGRSRRFTGDIENVLRENRKAKVPPNESSPSVR